MLSNTDLMIGTKIAVKMIFLMKIWGRVYKIGIGGKLEPRDHFDIGTFGCHTFDNFKLSKKYIESQE